MKTIYNTYVVMESQEQCDRMKKLCIDNGLLIWGSFDFTENEKNIFSKDKDDIDFLVMSSSSNIKNYSNIFIEVTEQEFIELLKLKLWKQH